MVHFLSCKPRDPVELPLETGPASPPKRGKEGSGRGWGQVGGRVALFPCTQVFCSGAALNCIQLPWCLGGGSVNGIHLLFCLLSFINQVSLRKLQYIFL